MLVGERFKRLRFSKSYSQEYVADHLAISQSSYSKLETDRVSPSLIIIEKVCKLYQVSLVDFFTDAIHATETHHADIRQDDSPGDTLALNMSTIKSIQQQLYHLSQRVHELERMHKKI